MNVLDNPIPLPRAVIERLRATDTPDDPSKPEWFTYFMQGRHALFDTEKWQRILITMGRRIWMGEAAFLDEISVNESLLDVHRLFQATHTSFMRYCFHQKPQLNSIDTWSCYSIATQAIRIFTGEVPNDFIDSEKKCIFTGSNDFEHNTLVWFAYLVTDPISKIQHIDTSPSFVISKNYITVLQSLMAVGQAEIYLKDALHSLIKDAKTQNNEELATDLLKNALTHPDINATVTMINNAAYFLFLFHEIPALLRL